MKRLWVLSITVLFVILLSACSDNASDAMKSNKDNMIINIKNNANFDFYSIGFKTYKNGELKTSGGVSYADGSKIQKGESLRKEYIDQKDLKLEGEASFEVVLLGKDQTNQVPLNTVTLELTTNKEYFFEITGESSEQAELKRVK
ncbi:hypothetical protein SAMN05421676_11316 [Salinibacillus kushneri]|uniref:Lipoprotein n=1 Tax=Salinibacillus kushneri TaxID=237682 RepID=A0A1I0IM48_9BACI|nr:hypothetical protein [Salinibacillus kushneri]SET98151.1 hypothetical protein SAMN05421676_11316 [Salinibacillus kushneri]